MSKIYGNSVFNLFQFDSVPGTISRFPGSSNPGYYYYPNGFQSNKNSNAVFWKLPDPLGILPVASANIFWNFGEPCIFLGGMIRLNIRISGDGTNFPANTINVTLSPQEREKTVIVPRSANDTSPETKVRLFLFMENFVNGKPTDLYPGSLCQQGGLIVIMQVDGTETPQELTDAGVGGANVYSPNDPSLYKIDQISEGAGFGEKSLLFERTTSSGALQKPRIVSKYNGLHF